MFNADLYRKTDKTVRELFVSNWEVGFDLWRRCLFNIQMLVEDTLPYDMRYGGDELMDRFNLHDKSMKERAYFMDAFVKNAGVGDPGFVTILEGQKGITFPGGTYFAKAYKGQAGHAITGKRWFVREIKCLAAGDECCEFVVKEKE
jgi:hypothetical protein